MCRGGPCPASIARPASVTDTRRAASERTLQESLCSLFVHKLSHPKLLAHLTGGKNSSPAVYTRSQTCKEVRCPVPGTRLSGERKGSQVQACQTYICVCAFPGSPCASVALRHASGVGSSRTASHWCSRCTCGCPRSLSIDVSPLRMREVAIRAMTRPPELAWLRHSVTFASWRVPLAFEMQCQRHPLQVRSRRALRRPTRHLCGAHVAPMLSCSRSSSQLAWKVS